MLNRALKWALRIGLRKGAVEGQTAWLVVAAVAGVWQLARRPERGAVARIKLRPGEHYEILCGDGRVPR